jgi:hypothetical protein
VQTSRAFSSAQDPPVHDPYAKEFYWPNNIPLVQSYSFSVVSLEGCASVEDVALVSQSIQTQVQLWNIALSSSATRRTQNPLPTAQQPQYLNEHLSTVLMARSGHVSIKLLQETPEFSPKSEQNTQSDFPQHSQQEKILAHNILQNMNMLLESDIGCCCGCGRACTCEIRSAGYRNVRVKAVCGGFCVVVNEEVVLLAWNALEWSRYDLSRTPLLPSTAQFLPLELLCQPFWSRDDAPGLSSASLQSDAGQQRLAAPCFLLRFESKVQLGQTAAPLFTELQVKCVDGTVVYADHGVLPEVVSELKGSLSRDIGSVYELHMLSDVRQPY